MTRPESAQWGNAILLPTSAPSPYRMAMPIVPTPRRYSVLEVLDFPPDGNRYEQQAQLVIPLADLFAPPDR